MQARGRVIGVGIYLCAESGRSVYTLARIASLNLRWLSDSAYLSGSPYANPPIVRVGLG